MISEIAVAQPQTSLVARFADRFGVDKGKLLTTLKATAFRQRGDRTAITDEQMMALLVVAEQYKLNPFTKEIFAFDDKGSIIPVVSVDGWARIINEHPALNGVEFRYAETSTKMPRGKDCPDWCEVIIHRKDRERPTIVREYLDEVYQAPRGKDGGYDGPWQTHTKRFLRHKTFIQGARLAFGFAGIFDEDEAQRIVTADQPPAKERAKAATAALVADAMPVEVVDMDTGEVLTDAQQESGR
jgi:phage recombination protein Bet